jgi:hypothetical protein
MKLSATPRIEDDRWLGGLDTSLALGELLALERFVLYVQRLTATPSANSQGVTLYRCAPATLADDSVTAGARSYLCYSGPGVFGGVATHEILSFGQNPIVTLDDGMALGDAGTRSPSYSLFWAPSVLRSGAIPISRWRTWRSASNSPCSATTRSGRGSGGSLDQARTTGPCHATPRHRARPFSNAGALRAAEKWHVAAEDR